MTEPRTYHPEATARDGWTRGGTLYLVDGEPVGSVEVSAAEWQRLEAAGVDRLFSGQVQEVTWHDADRQVREVLGKGFSR